MDWNSIYELTRDIRKQKCPSQPSIIVKLVDFSTTLFLSLFVFRCSPSAVVVFPDDSDFGARCDGGVSADIARGRSRRVAHCHGKGQKSLEWSTDRTKKILLTTKLSGSIQWYMKANENSYIKGKMFVLTSASSLENIIDPTVLLFTYRCS